jgi:hypothetical protein
MSETGTGQQLAQHHDSCMMMVVMMMMMMMMMMVMMMMTTTTTTITFTHGCHICLTVALHVTRRLLIVGCFVFTLVQ